MGPNTEGLILALLANRPHPSKASAPAWASCACCATSIRNALSKSPAVPSRSARSITRASPRSDRGRNSCTPPSPNCALQAEYATWLDSLPQAAARQPLKRCRPFSISISTTSAPSSHPAALVEIEPISSLVGRVQLGSYLTRHHDHEITPTTRWETPPRPPSDRNGGRFQIGMPGRRHRNPQRQGRGCSSTPRARPRTEPRIVPRTDESPLSLL